MRIAALAIAALLVPVAQASPVSLCGTSVCYEYDDDAVANPGILLLGAPTLLGNSDVLRFVPTVFNGWVPGGEAGVEAEFRFSRIWSPDGLEIGVVRAASSGDYQVLGAGAATARLFLAATDAAHDTGSGDYPEFVSAGAVFDSPGATGLPFLNWNLEQALHPAAAFTDPAGSIGLTILARLESLAPGAEDGAFIAQKLLLVSATTVPAPSALPLALTGLAALVGMRARRARNQAR